MRFVLPTMAYSYKAKAFIQEFYENHSEINGSGALDRYLQDSTYEQWLQKVMADMDIANIDEGRVPAYTYFYVREEDDEIVGMINIRMAQNDFLRNEVGHIGYCIRPSERRKGYATGMLRQVLQFCGKALLQDVIITCNKDNIASAQVIKKCGGKLEKEGYSQVFQEIIQIYRITQNKDSSE